MKKQRFIQALTAVFFIWTASQIIGCSHAQEFDREELIALALEQSEEILCAPVDVNGLKANEMLPGDIPIFSESTLTYVNRIPFQNSVNVFHRYNISEDRMQEVIDYYKSIFPEYGWEVNAEKSTATKLFLKKDKTFVTLRIFEMPLVEEEFKTAFTINLVKPKNN